jgi:lysozyme family protein
MIATEERFQECAAFVIARETSYDKDGEPIVDRDANDPGGTTKFGIDQRSYPHIDIANLTIEQAIEFYRKDKWDPFRCGDMKAPWDLAVFDSAVNPGEGWTPKHLQAAVGAKVDGWIGDNTIEAVNNATDQMLVEFLRARCQYYRNRPAMINGKLFRDKYIKGWLSRVAILAEETLGSGADSRVLAA